MTSKTTLKIETATKSEKADYCGLNRLCGFVTVGEHRLPVERLSEGPEGFRIEALAPVGFAWEGGELHHVLARTSADLLEQLEYLELEPFEEDPDYVAECCNEKRMARRCRVGRTDKDGLVFVCPKCDKPLFHSDEKAMKTKTNRDMTIENTTTADHTVTILVCDECDDVRIQGEGDDSVCPKCACTVARSVDVKMTEREHAVWRWLRETEDDRLNPEYCTATRYNDDRIDTPHGQYLCLTDDEADRMVRKQLRDYVNECLEIPDTIRPYFDEDAWVRDALRNYNDGKNMILGELAVGSRYGSENEYQADDGAWWYIYRRPTVANHHHERGTMSTPRDIAKLCSEIDDCKAKIADAVNDEWDAEMESYYDSIRDTNAPIAARLAEIRCAVMNLREHQSQLVVAIRECHEQAQGAES